jgi:hypothetical protein
MTVSGPRPARGRRRGGRDPNSGHASAVRGLPAHRGAVAAGVRLGSGAHVRISDLAVSGPLPCTKAAGVLATQGIRTQIVGTSDGPARES